MNINGFYSQYDSIDRKMTIVSQVSLYEHILHTYVRHFLREVCASKYIQPQVCVRDQSSTDFIIRNKF